MEMVINMTRWKWKNILLDSIAKAGRNKNGKYVMTLDHIKGNPRYDNTPKKPVTNFPLVTCKKESKKLEEFLVSRKMKLIKQVKVGKKLTMIVDPKKFPGKRQLSKELAELYPKKKPKGGKPGRERKSFTVLFLEDSVKKHLKNEGYTVRTRTKRKRMSNHMTASKGNDSLTLNVVPHTTSHARSAPEFERAIGSLAASFEKSGATLGVVVPNTPPYHRVVAKFSKDAKKTLGITYFFVDSDGNVKRD